MGVAICVGLVGAFMEIPLYVMISNLCSVYMKTISQIIQIMGALWPNLAEQGDFISRNLQVFSML